MDITTLTEHIITLAKEKKLLITTAESCTGGMVAAALTDISGASAVFERGFITYDNLAKHQMLGVPLSLLQSVGAVSKEVAKAMAEGALNHSPCHLSVAVTGIAGPTGGTAEKPVGLVHIASKFMAQETIHEEHHFSGTRPEIRHAATHAALNLLLKMLKK